MLPISADRMPCTLSLVLDHALSSALYTLIEFLVIFHTLPKCHLLSEVLRTLPGSIPSCVSVVLYILYFCYSACYIILVYS